MKRLCVFDPGVSVALLGLIKSIRTPSLISISASAITLIRRVLLVSPGANVRVGDVVGLLVCGSRNDQSILSPVAVPPLATALTDIAFADGPESLTTISRILSNESCVSVTLLNRLSKPTVMAAVSLSSIRIVALPAAPMR